MRSKIQNKINADMIVTVDGGLPLFFD